MADGLDVSVYECGACKLHTQDVNFLLMTPYAQLHTRLRHSSASYFVFSSGFHQLLKTNIAGSSEC